MRPSLAILLLLAVVPPTSLTAGTGLLDFEGFADSTILTTQYSGLTFSNAIILSSGISLNEFECPPHSGTNTLLDNGGPITITFRTPAGSFSGFFTYRTQMYIRAFDAQNNLLGTASSKFSGNLALSGIAGSSPNEALQISSSMGISQVVITGDPAGSSFAADDLATSALMPQFSLNPTSANLSANGGSGTIGVTANLPDAAWTAVTNATWITITSGASGMGSGSVGYSVAVNTGTTPLTGTITVAGQAFTVTEAGVASLSVTKTHTGNLMQGQTGAAYMVTVSNAAAAGTTSGMVTVCETPPVGLTLASMSGPGWMCGNGSCTRGDPLAGGGSYPPITVTVNVAGGANSPQVNEVSVSGGGSVGANANDSTVIATPITIQSLPAGLQFIVDGGAAQTAPQTLSLPPGMHAIAVVTTQSGAVGTQYVFTGWSDSGAASHSITVGSAAATYIAGFETQYQLTISASSAAGGMVTPASGTFYDAGTAVPITATAASGYIFSAWTGTVASSGSASTTVTMAAAQTVTANFTAGQAPPPVTVFSPAQGATIISLTASMTWGAVTGATSYDVYFGTSTTPPFLANTTGLSYAPGALSPGITYYWSVTAKNAFGSTISAVWSFMTAGTLPGLRFVTVTPCRVMDTRLANATFGGPVVPAGGTRNVPVPQSACSIPTTAQAYSLNVTVVPPAGLTYLTVWPTGQTQPYVSTLNSLDSRIVANAAIVPAGMNGSISVFASDATHVVIDINGYFTPASTSGSLSFYPATPCRVADTRNANGNFGGPFLSGGSTRTFVIPSSSCGIPTMAQAYSLNVTVVPHTGLGYLTAWPTGQAQPYVSTLNSLDGSVVANAAIVPAGTGGGVSVYVTNDTDVVIDIDGYFAPAVTAGALSLYTLIPCRVADSRNPTGPFGGPSLPANGTRNFTMPSSACSVPSNAQAYSLNVTVVPPGPLTYLTAWPTGQTQPYVSTLNSYEGKVVANAALVPAGTSGGMTVFVSNATDVVLDINGYFGQ